MITVISNRSGLLIQSNCDEIPAWTFRAVGSRVGLVQLKRVRLVVLLLHSRLCIASPFVVFFVAPVAAFMGVKDDLGYVVLTRRCD